MLSNGQVGVYSPVRLLYVGVYSFLLRINRPALFGTPLSPLCVMPFYLGGFTATVFLFGIVKIGKIYDTTKFIFIKFTAVKFAYASDSSFLLNIG